jgi:hypothetical protein
MKKSLKTKFYCWFNTSWFPKSGRHYQGKRMACGLGKLWGLVEVTV